MPPPMSSRVTLRVEKKIVIGVNKFAEDDAMKTDVFPIDEAQQRAQVERVRLLKTRRENEAVRAALGDVRTAARGRQIVLIP